MVIINSKLPTAINIQENSLSYQENLREIYSGLKKNQKELSPKYFYDENGSNLFDQITDLDEYYPSRTETNILLKNINEISSSIVADSVLIEYGSGSSQKTRILLDNFLNLAAYVSIDISGDYLHSSAKKLQEIYKDLMVIPLVADYTKPIKLPQIKKYKGNRVAFFPGSTIGNFYPKKAVEFLKNIRNEVGESGGLIIGVDLHKKSSILNAAYNDEKGITAKFNLNMLRHINTVYNGNFDNNNFYHHAFYNEAYQRIEMHLVSKKNQSVDISGEMFSFEKHETIRTEVSHKYTPESFEKLANLANFKIANIWTDDQNLFSVQYLTSQPIK